MSLETSVPPPAPRSRRARQLAAALGAHHTVAAEPTFPGAPAPQVPPAWRLTPPWLPPGTWPPSRTGRSAATPSPAKRKTTSVRGSGAAGEALWARLPEGGSQRLPPPRGRRGPQQGVPPSLGAHGLCDPRQVATWALASPPVTAGAAPALHLTAPGRPRQPSGAVWGWTAQVLAAVWGHPGLGHSPRGFSPSPGGPALRALSPSVSSP